MTSLRNYLASLLLLTSFVPGCKNGSGTGSDTDAGIGGSSSPDGIGGSSSPGGTGGVGSDPSPAPDASSGGTPNSGGDAGAGDAGGLSIVGSYASSYSTVTITSDRYLEEGDGFTLDQEIVAFDNDEDYFITLDPASPGTEYSKVLWVEQDGSLYICTALFFQESLEDASAEDDADREDLVTGCGTFAWTELSPRLREDEGPDAG